MAFGTHHSRRADLIRAGSTITEYTVGATAFIHSRRLRRNQALLTGFIDHFITGSKIIPSSGFCLEPRCAARPKDVQVARVMARNLPLPDVKRWRFTRLLAPAMGAVLHRIVHGRSVL
jgi:hypothetical protein